MMRDLFWQERSHCFVPDFRLLSGPERTRNDAGYQSRARRDCPCDDAGPHSCGRGPQAFPTALTVAPPLENNQLCKRAQNSPLPPPIGHGWLEDKLTGLLARLQVLDLAGRNRLRHTAVTCTPYTARVSDNRQNARWTNK
jgi:hypothetical protein